MIGRSGIASRSASRYNDSRFTWSIVANACSIIVSTFALAYLFGMNTAPRPFSGFDEATSSVRLLLASPVSDAHPIRWIENSARTAREKKVAAGMTSTVVFTPIRVHIWAMDSTSLESFTYRLFGPWNVTPKPDGYPASASIFFARSGSYGSVVIVGSYPLSPSGINCPVGAASPSMIRSRNPSRLIAIDRARRTRGSRSGLASRRLPATSVTKGVTGRDASG